MKAIVCEGKGDLDILKEKQLPVPELRDYDVLVDVKAVAVNPVDGKSRASGFAGEHERVLGYDGAGIVTKLGSKVGDAFAIGDEVYFGGDVTRAGSYAEQIAIDSRICAKKPSSMSFADAAAYPLVTLTAWEGFFENLGVPVAEDNNLNVLVLNGAGGVGSMITQLVSNLVKPKTLIASASRDSTKNWCKSMGATHTINHHNDLKEELTAIGVENVDIVYCCVDLDIHWEGILKVLATCGKICSITFNDASKIDATKLFFPLRGTLSFELMFARPIANKEPERQGAILKRVAEMIDAGQIKSVTTEKFEGFTLENIKKMQEKQDSGKAIGKIVCSF